MRTVVGIRSDRGTDAAEFEVGRFMEQHVEACAAHRSALKLSTVEFSICHAGSVLQDNVLFSVGLEIIFKCRARQFFPGMHTRIRLEP